MATRQARFVNSIQQSRDTCELTKPLYRVVEGVAVGVGEWDATGTSVKVHYVDIEGKRWMVPKLATYIRELEDELDERRRII